MSAIETHEDLSGKTSRGAALTLLGNLLVKSLSVIVIVLITANLYAEIYGHAILALAVFGFAEVVTNPALQTTLLREPDLRDETIDVAWTLSLARGVILTTTLWFAAPSIALLWPDQAAVMEGYLRVLSLSFAVAGCANLHTIRLRRDLKFGRAFLVESAGPVIGTLSVIIALPLTGESLWIISGPVLGSIAGTLVSLIYVRPLPRMRLSGSEVRRLWRFSRPLMLSTIMIFVLLNGDDIFVESVAGFAALGLYEMSFRWSNTGVNLAVHGLQNVLTPAYVKMRGDPARLKHAVVSLLSVLSAVCVLISGLFLAFADEFFLFLGGNSEWSGAAPVARALVPFVLSRGLNASLSPVFLVLGKPHWLTWMTAAQLALFLPAMYIGNACLGLPGIALGVALLSLGVSVATMVWIRHLLAMKTGDFAVALLPAFLTTGAAVLTGWLCVADLSDPAWRLFLGGGITVLMFLGLWELMCRRPIARRWPQRSFLALAGMLTR